MCIIRTGFSFKNAVGHLSEVASRVKEIGANTIAVADTCSTYSFVKLTKEAEKADLRVVYGCELMCCPELGAKRQGQDRWIFLAKDDLRFIHDLIGMATENPGSEPCLTYRQALEAQGVIKIMGEAAQVRLVEPQEGLFLGLSPATPRGQLKAAREAGHPFLAYPNNRYPRKEDLEFYRVTLGRSAGSQTYLMHIMDDTEYAEALGWVNLGEICKAIDNRDEVLSSCQAKLKKASLLIPDKPKDLRQLCLEGAQKLGCDLSRSEYMARLDRELAMIKEKEFEDYFYIVADIMAFARDKMCVGPARGSSASSLVCYLLGITSIDPIPFNLVFERFIDITRKDLPDIDIDFSEKNRHLVFEYVSNKYGRDRSARLGSVNMFKAKSALNQVGANLKIPKYLINEVSNAIIKRHTGDARAKSTIEDALHTTEAGQRVSKDHPEIEIVTRMEGHPAAAAQHAAGIVLTDSLVKDYVAVNHRTGATMCDKRDAEDLNLLKIDALGLLQLTVFERCLELMGKPQRNEFLEKIPLDDQAAFDVMNEKRFSGIFQFIPGAATVDLVELVLSQGGKLNKLDDLVALTAIVRPGPLNSGQAEEWIRRRVGKNPVSYAHSSLEPYLKSTYGLVLYQEQVLAIGRELGDLTWEDVTALRKAMSKSLGKEYFSQFAEKWVEGAIQKVGMPREIGIKFFDELCLSGDTQIRRSLRKKDVMTIKEMYEKYELTFPYYYTKPSLMSLHEDGRVRPQRSVRIIKSGEKECWKYIFNDGSHVTCTKEHRFIINGDWKPIEEASIGDEFLSAVPDYSKSGIRGMRNGMGKGSGPRDEKTGRYIGLGPNQNKIVEDFRKEKLGMECEDCYQVKKVMEVHHNDFVDGKKYPRDIAWLCRSCHIKRHGKQMGAWKVGYGTTFKKLESIEYVGIQDVYDISMPKIHNFMLQNGLITHNCNFGSWAFNLSHSVAYGVVSYWCCWLKAHHPLEFCAATLDSHKNPFKQIEMLRELRQEGVSYVPVDADKSTTKWELDKERRLLVGPLTNVIGIGPKKVQLVMDSRENGSNLKPALRKLLEHAKTPIDSLDPIRDAIQARDLKKLKIKSNPMPVKDVVQSGEELVCVFGLISRLSTVDLNDPDKVAKRGYEISSGPTRVIRFWIRDDTDEVFCRINQWKTQKWGDTFIQRARVKKSLFAVKGSAPADFPMINVEAVRYIGEIDHDPKELAAAVNGTDQEADPRGLSRREEGLKLEGELVEGL